MLIVCFVLSEPSVNISKKKFQCTLCEKQFTRREQLKKHELKHKDPSEYLHECDICKKKFTQITQLKQHTRNHHKASDRKSTPHVRATRSSRRAVNGKEQTEQKKYDFLKLLC